MTKLQIIGAPQSVFVRVVRIAAEEQKIIYELVPALPHSSEVLAIHPLGKIPVMRHGEVRLCESHAILAYFERTFEGAALSPADPLEACQVEQWVSMLQTSFLPVFQRSYLAAYFFPGTADGSPDRMRIQQAIPEIDRYLGILEEGVKTTGYLGGRTFTRADVYAAPTLLYMKDLPESSAMIATRPALADWLARLEQRPSIMATIPPAFEAKDRQVVERLRKAAGG